MLSKFGYKGTMISLGLALIIIGHICLIFIKRRIPIPKYDHSTSRTRRAGGQKVDWSFLRRPVLLSGVLTILITSLGSFVPVVWLPSEICGGHWYKADVQRTLRMPGS
jgi:predicted MFS family arabinose efflux permease